MRPSAGDGREGASAAVLRTESLTVRFGGLTALDNVDFAIARGEIRAIIGPNGAGKSTFFNCLTGAPRPSTGRILFNGEDITGLSPNRVSQKGDRDVLTLHDAALLMKSYDGQSAFRLEKAVASAGTGLPRIGEVVGIVDHPPVATALGEGVRAVTSRWFRFHEEARLRVPAVLMGRCPTSKMRSALALGSPACNDHPRPRECRVVALCHE